MGRGEEHLGGCVQRNAEISLREEWVEGGRGGSGESDGEAFCGVDHGRPVP